MNYYRWRWGSVDRVPHSGSGKAESTNAGDNRALALPGFGFGFTATTYRPRGTSARPRSRSQVADEVAASAARRRSYWSPARDCAAVAE